MGWTAVAQAVPNTLAIAWDGCHKIYALLDQEQVNYFRDLGYGDGTDATLLVSRVEASPLMNNPPVAGVDVEKATDAVLLTTLREWFEDSCGLRFISAVATDHFDPNAGFTNLIAQGEQA